MREENASLEEEAILPNEYPVIVLYVQLVPPDPAERTSLEVTLEEKELVVEILAPAKDVSINPAYPEEIVIVPLLISLAGPKFGGVNTAPEA